MQRNATQRNATHVCMYVCMYVTMHVCMCMCMCICICICICVCVCVCMYVYIYRCATLWTVYLSCLFCSIGVSSRHVESLILNTFCHRNRLQTFAMADRPPNILQYQSNYEECCHTTNFHCLIVFFLSGTVRIWHLVADSFSTWIASWYLQSFFYITFSYIVLHHPHMHSRHSQLIEMMHIVVIGSYL